MRIITKEITDNFFSTSKEDEKESKRSREGTVLELSLAYDTKHSTLIVSVVAIHQFQALVNCGDYGPASIASPYVRLQLLLRDGRRLKAKTQVVRTVAGGEPAQFGETFAFRDLHVGLPGSRLHAAVLGFDRFSRDAVLGEVTVPPDDGNYQFQTRLPVVLDRFSRDTVLGEVIMSPGAGSFQFQTWLPAGGSCSNSRQGCRWFLTGSRGTRYLER